MIAVENIDVWGFKHAIRGMRNPFNSWEKSDSRFYYDEKGSHAKIGENDLKLMRQLYKGGTEHRKYLRQIVVSFDLIAPLYFWKQFDTYKVGTATNSCSTMHKIADHEFTLQDFSTEHLSGTGTSSLVYLLTRMNQLRRTYLHSSQTSDEFGKTKEDYWWDMIQLLPTSYNQKRTVLMNYENVVTIIKQRRGHRLTEWHELIDVFMDLPYIAEIIAEDGDE